ALDSDGFGTDQPIQTARTLVEVSGATIRSHAGAIFDTMLFNATAPIFSVSNNSDLRFETDAIRFSDKVRMTSAGPILRLDGSTISANTILNLNNSLLTVNGDLFSLSNGSSLIASGGPLIRVNNSVLYISGALAAFLGTGNIISVSNTLCA